jgi:hypothetical protein
VQHATGPNQYPTKYSKSQYGDVYKITSQLLKQEKEGSSKKNLQYSYSNKESKFNCRIFNGERDYQFQIGFFTVLSQPQLYVQILRVKQGDDLNVFDRPAIIDIIEQQLLDSSFTRQETRKNTTTIFQRSIISTKTLQESTAIVGMNRMTEDQLNGVLNHSIQCCVQAPSLEMKLYGIRTMRQFITQSYFSSFIQNKVNIQEKIADAVVYLIDGGHGWEVNEQAVMTLASLINSDITNELFNQLICRDNKYHDVIKSNLQRIAEKKVVERYREQHAVDQAKSILLCI